MLKLKDVFFSTQTQKTIFILEKMKESAARLCK